jgi:iron complex outermembrane receptor protein
MGGIVLAAAITAIPAVCGAAPDTQDQAVGLDAVIVTGTRRSERTVATSSAPIDVVTADVLGTVPSPDLLDKLMQTVPSFNAMSESGLDGDAFVRPASLRSLSSDETMVLINGKREHRSAYIDTTPQRGSQSVDLSQIPAIAIERMEVLRDGASAQYGSDAIAGVINIILNDKPGVAVDTHVGKNYKGDGFNDSVAARAGFALPGSGTLILSGEYAFTNYSSGSLSPARIGQPRTNNGRLWYNFAKPINDAIEIYSFGHVNTGSGTTDLSYRSPATYSAPSYYQVNPPFRYPTFSFLSIFPNGFVPSFRLTSTDAGTAVGLRGDLTSQLHWDLSGRYGRSHVRFNVDDTLNLALGPLTPTTFESGSQTQTETGVNLDFNYLPVREVNVAFGTEFRTEQFQLNAGDPASYQIGPFADLQIGANGYPGASPADAGKWSRNSKAAYLDVDVDPTSTLNLSGAVRYENYSDFGGTTNYKFSGLYQAFDFLSVRGTISTGFRAPTPGQEHLTSTQQTQDPSSTVVPQPIVTDALVPPTSPLAANFGGTRLRPEESRNYSAGLVLRPISRMTLTVDAYKIDINRRIALLPFTPITPAETAQLVAEGIPGAAKFVDYRFFVNGLNTRTQGVDVVGAFGRPLGSGDLNVTLAYNHNHTEILGLDQRMNTLDTYQFYEHHLPNDTAILTTAYDIGAFSVQGRARYYGPWIDVTLTGQIAGLNEQVAGITLFDLSTSYRVNDAVTVTVGALNLFNRFPQEEQGLLRRFGQLYPIFSAYNHDGGQYYVRLAAKF